MKRVLLVLLIIVLILIAGIYLFIPGKIQISRTVMIPVTPPAAFRVLSEKNNWKKWWPDESYERDSTNKNNTFFYNGYSYQLSQKFFNTVGVIIKNKHDAKIISSINILSMHRDSVALEWQTETVLSKNPLKRIQDSREAREIENDIGVILSHIQSFLAEKENVYGMKIQKTIVKDTLMISTKFFSRKYPTTAEIYSSIKKLREYISKKGVSETNYPMLNISMTDSNNFQTMVAIPINELLKDNSNISLKRMVRGNILEAEVKGGEFTAREALTQLDNYVKDYNMDSPAIPFELLITDRSKELDTTKWITKLYYPIF